LTPPVKIAGFYGYALEGVSINLMQFQFILQMSWEFWSGSLNFVSTRTSTCPAFSLKRISINMPNQRQTTAWNILANPSTKKSSHHFFSNPIKKWYFKKY